VAYGIGRNFDINYIMLEIHFVPAGENTRGGKSNGKNQNKGLSASSNVSGISFQGTNIRYKLGEMYFNSIIIENFILQAKILSRNDGIGCCWISGTSWP
jgi:hypothetical protein